ncbi:MAG: TRAP transporter permease [Halorhabdus sp.]
MSNGTANQDSEDDEIAEALNQLETESLFEDEIPQQAWNYLEGDRPFSVTVVIIFFVLAMGVIAAAWHLYTGATGLVAFYLTRPIHVFLILGLGLFVYGWDGEKRDFERVSWRLGVDCLLYLALAASTFYPAFSGDFRARYAYSTFVTTDIVMAAVLTVLILELTRRALGYIFLGFILLFIGYTLGGGNLPGPLSHSPVTLKQFLVFEYMSVHGIWTTPIGVMARYVTLFIIFGAFLDSSKGGLLIQHLGNKLAGGSAGGPAKVAVITSSLMGMISGSALANVSTTGSFTIPLMKRLGYPPEDAGGIESAASSGGQLTPPIMGAVAFVMASIARVPYLTIIILATVPALLYYTSLFISAHVTAKREGLAALPEEQRPTWHDIAEYAHMAIPIIGIVAVLGAGYSVIRSALVGIALVWISAMLRSNTRLGVKQFLASMYAAAKTTIVASVACASAGLVIGMIQLTGLGVRLSSSIVGLSSGNILLGLFLVMIVTVLLGMGMPTVPAYAITVAIGIPALLDLGMNKLAAHLFIVYFAVMSLITPPVMVGSYAAASIADANPMKTGISGVKFALLAFVMPYVFILNPELLIVAVPTSTLTLLQLLVTAMLGAVFVGMGTGGYVFSTLNYLQRGILISAGIGLLWAGTITDALGLAFGIVVIAISAEQSISELAHQNFEFLR